MLLELILIQYYWIVAIAWHTFQLFDNIIRSKRFGKYSIETPTHNNVKKWFTFRNRVVLYSATGLFVNVLLVWTFWRCYCSNQLPFAFVAYLQKSVFNSKNQIAPETILIGLILHLIHLSCRIYETTYQSVHCWREGFNLVHVVSFFLNEIVVVLSIVAEAPNFATYKDCFQLKNFSSMSFAGIVLFYFAIKIRRNSLKHLKSLRKNRSGHIVTTAYKLPHGSYFQSWNVSNPQHLAELLVHLSVGIVLGFGDHVWLFVCFDVAIRLLDRSVSAHNYYLNKFENCPKTRSIFIPYLL